jgi:hypothetical protein
MTQLRGQQHVEEVHLPSEGAYYCAPCDHNFNSYTNFKSHSESVEHKLRSKLLLEVTC